jgi:DNA-binding winged helix-turn-helix (wHTH) protein/TolB-like protein/Tfp pilus assembly protein PilF
VKRSTTNGVRHFYEFGDFRLDAERHRLWRGGNIVPVPLKAIETLTLLVRNPGKVLERQTLMDALWPNTIVEDANLTVAISQLRKAFGQNGDIDQFIETIPRIGYRFTPEISEVDEAVPLIKEEPLRENGSGPESGRSPDLADGIRNGASTTLLATEGESPVSPAKSAIFRALNLRTIALAALFVMMLVAFLIYRQRANRGALPATSGPIKSLAVLPFKSLGPHAQDEYLGLGLADTLITQLSTMNQIAVRPLSAVQKYSGTGSYDPLAAGRDLRVDIVLEGYAQQEGDILRVTMRLLRVTDGVALWSAKFDEKVSDIFTMQDLIARHVAQASVLHLSEGEKQELLTTRHTNNREAYQLYLKGRYFWNKRTGPDLELGLSYFEQAIKLDPFYARAYSGLADCYAVLSYFTTRPFTETFPKAKAAAEKALELDGSLGEPHATLGLVLHTSWDWGPAEQEYEKGLKLNPNYATAHQWYGFYLMSVGRLDASVQELKRAQELDPVSIEINSDLGAVLTFAHRPDEGIKYFKAALEMDRNFIEAHAGLGLAYVEKGELDQGISELERARELSHDRPDVLATLGYADAIAAKTADATTILTQLRAMPKENNVSPCYLAEVLVGLGEKEDALAALETAVVQRDAGLSSLKANPIFDPLRSEPRFQNLLVAIGLKP